MTNWRCAYINSIELSKIIPRLPKNSKHFDTNIKYNDTIVVLLFGHLWTFFSK